MALLPRLIFLLVALLALVIPASASAELWPAAAEPCGGSGTERGSGQLDARGWSYMVCSKTDGGVAYHHIRVLDAAGNLNRLIPLVFDGDGTIFRLASDVAPSPDGSFLYVINYDERTPYRFNRQGDGSYRIDRSWSLARFPAAGGGAGVYNPRGMFLNTDGNGDIYMSMGLWSADRGTDQTVVKYRADGTYVTRFGTAADSWEPGVAYNAFTGLAVTADGARVFVADILNSRVHRFDRQPDGTYLAQIVMGNAPTDPGNPRGGTCGTAGKLAAPYDVSMSPGGELLVISTSCLHDGTLGYPAGTIEVVRFGQDGSARGVVHAVSASGMRTHGIFVDRQGRIHLIQGGIVVTPPAGYSDAGAAAGSMGPMGGTAPQTPTDNGGLVPGSLDRTAPTLTSASGPADTTRATITLALAATDNVGVTGVRVNEDGTQYAWRPYSASLVHTMSDRIGAHVLVVQVRDAAGLVSNTITVRIIRVADQIALPVPTTPVVTGGGGGGGEVMVESTDRTAPVIRRLVTTHRTTRRTLVLTIRATDDRAATQVRVAGENGRWGRWKPLTARTSTVLASGTGWHMVFVQVRDAAGNRSSVHATTTLLASPRAAWQRGGSGVDRLVGTRRSDHFDLSQFDSKVDRVRCGAGYDTVLLQPGDIAAHDCERVIRVVNPRW